MNPDTNKFENLAVDFSDLEQQIGKMVEQGRLLRPDGTPVPEHWSVFQVDEEVVIKNYCFKVAYIGESTLLLEPVGPIVIKTEDQEKQDGQDR